MSSAPSYYRPYESADELTSDEEDSASEFSDASISDTEDIRIRREEDPRYAIYRAAGPALTTLKDKNAYLTQLPNTDMLQAGPYDTGTDITSFENHVYLDPPKTTKTSLVSIKSINRDRNVYPTPYYFKIKLPRVYKNVTKFQMVQMSFPNNNTTNTSQVNLITSTIVQNLLLRGVPSSCISDCIGVLNCTTSGNSMALIEQGRVNASGEPLLVTLPIDDGFYEDGALARELTFKANCTPPLNIITYDEFRDVFMNTRDVSVLFNEPGEGFYSATTQQRLGGHHTKQDIMNTYYTQQHIDSLPVITERVAFNAYYFPILKEMLATRRAEPFLQLPDTDPLLSGVTYNAAADRILGFFEGLDSEFYEALGRANQGSLDAYRRHLTFELRNVNRYQILHQSAESRFRVVHDRLHPSLQKDIGNRYHMILNQQLSIAGLNSNSFDSLKTVQRVQSAIYRHLETNLSTQLGHYHFMANYRYDGGDTHGEYSVDQLNTDEAFTSMFQYRSSFGGLYGTYEGTVMQFSTFADYHSTMYSYYHQIKSTSDQVSSIYGHVQNAHHLYVSTKYSNVLPNRMIETRSYSQNQGIPVSFVMADSVYIPGQSLGQIDPSSGAANIITYNAATCNQICCSTIRNLIKTWYSELPTAFVIRTPQYRLGVLDVYPTNFNLISTVLNITSTGNLNYFMKINDEQGFNNMDIAMPENYMVSNDTTGQVKMMCAKILMGGVGDTGISQTVIQNPSLFENTLGKLDKLEVKIYYDDQDLTPAWVYQPYFLDLTEWNATFQIDEEIGYANRATGWGYKPTVPVPTNPSDTPYLFVTHRDNPNNS